MRTLATWSPQQCCCGCGACAAWTESWTYGAGPVPDPPWVGIGGNPPIETVPGTIVNPVGGGLVARAIDTTITHSVAVTLTKTGANAVAAHVANDSFSQTLTAGWDGGQWYFTDVPAADQPGDTADVLFEWNDTNWQITLGSNVLEGLWAVPPFPAPDSAGVVIVQLTGGVEGDTSMGPIVTGCAVYDCAAENEDWSEYTPGDAVPDPPWTTLLGNPMVAGGGFAQNAAGGSLASREFDGSVHSFTTTLTKTGANQAFVYVADTPIFGDGVGVGWNGVSWEVVPFGGLPIPVTGPAGDTAAILFEWNDTDWAITIDGETVTDGWQVSPFPVSPTIILQLTGAVIGDSQVSPLLLSCARLSA